jgi:hypothetical protein
MQQKLKETITIQEATENLEAIISIDLDAPGPIGIWKKTRIVTDSRTLPNGAIDWIEEEGAESLLEILDASFRAVHEYLIFLSTSPEVDMRSVKSLAVVKNTVSLTANAAHKMEHYLNIKLGRTHAKINEREEFREMSLYYERYFSRDKTTDVEALIERNWDKENDLFKIHIDAEMPADDLRKSTHRPEYKAMFDYYQSQFAQDVVDAERSNATEIALKDMNEVRMDKDYELFCIRHEDGMPFYDLSILRNMRLECNFETDLEGFETDPLLQVRSVLDRDAAAAAGQILGECKEKISDFYKIFKKLVNNDLASCLGTICTALFLAHNPRNLLQNSIGKTSIQYFEDFHQFLRLSFRTAEYQKLIAYPPEKTDKMAYILLHLVHALSKTFFLRTSGVKQESIGLIHRTIRKGSVFETKEMKETKPQSIWAELLLEDEAYRTLLGKFPSGPLLKTLDLIRDEAEASVSFDPSSQGNYPFKLFEVGHGAARIDFLHLPSPTRQAVISKAEINDEFRGLLRSYIGSELKHVIINLQDRTSWKEITRCHALEGMQKNAEFSKVLFVATISKSTEFYHQNKRYETRNNAEEFMNFLMSQADSLDESGISLPTSYKQTEFADFSEKITLFIHTYFFEQKSNLTRFEREDFIEIFDLFFSLKLIDQYEPASVSFTCKDAVDTGAAQTAAFFAFLKLLGEGFAEKKDRDTFRWLCYHPALFVRERAINSERLNRVLSALQRAESVLQKNGKEITKEMEKFFKPGFLKHLEVKG